MQTRWPNPLYVATTTFHEFLAINWFQHYFSHTIETSQYIPLPSLLMWLQSLFFKAPNIPGFVINFHTTIVHSDVMFFVNQALTISDEKSFCDSPGCIIGMRHFPLRHIPPMQNFVLYSIQGTCASVVQIHVWMNSMRTMFQCTIWWLHRWCCECIHAIMNAVSNVISKLVLHCMQVFLKLKTSLWHLTLRSLAVLWSFRNHLKSLRDFSYSFLFSTSLHWRCSHVKITFPKFCAQKKKHMKHLSFTRMHVKETYCT